MNLTRYEQETIFNFNEEESTAQIYTCNKSLQNKLANLSKKFNDCCLVDSNDCASTYTIPKKWIKVSAPRQYSDEQRKKMAERAAVNLQKRKVNSQEDSNE